eukprot:gene6941-7488_t
MMKIFPEITLYRSVSGNVSAELSSNEPEENFEPPTQDKPKLRNFLFSWADNHYKPQAFDVWAMGMSTVLGGIYYGWNFGLDIGFGSYFIAQFLMGIAYIILICSLAEIISTTSFSGGAFGMARVVLGFYPGFLVACFELLEYLFYIAAATDFFSEFIQHSLNLEENWVPIIGLFIHILFALLLFEGNQIYWRINYIVGIATLLLLIFYCLGSLPFTNFSINASLQRDHSNKSALKNWFSGGILYFFKRLPLATRGFGGIESSALVTDLIDNSRYSISTGMVYAVLTLFVIMIFTLFVACSVSDGGLDAFSDLNYLLNPGFMKMGLTSHDAQWMIIPAQIARAFGFLLPASKLMQSMANSCLIPQGLAFRTSTLHASKLWSLVLSYGLFLIAFFYGSLDVVHVPIVAAMITYLSDLYAYYRLQTDLTSAAEKEFISPFGLIGAAFAAIVFAACFVSLIIFQFNVFFFMAGITILLTIYYFLYAKHVQKFSEQEQKTLLTLHVIQTNRRRRLKRYTPNSSNNNTNSNSTSPIVTRIKKLTSGKIEARGRTTVTVARTVLSRETTTTPVSPEDDLVTQSL